MMDIMSKIGTRLGNIDDLPEELKKQIPEFALGGLDKQVYIVLKENLEGIATLSEIMIALYQEFKIFDKSRQDVTDAVYRLIRKRVVEGVKGRKAVYKLTSLKLDEIESSNEADDLFAGGISEEVEVNKNVCDNVLVK